MLLPQIIMIFSAVPTIFNWLKLKLASRNPKLAQEKCLKRIIKQHANTSFGMQHRFRCIDNHEAYVNQVSVQTYDTLSGYMQVQRETGKEILTKDNHILYLKTSGTTQSSKFIPYTQVGYDQLSKQQCVAAYQCRKLFPRAFDGNQLIIAGSSIEGYLSNGAPYGSATGVMRACLQSWMKSKLTLPTCLSSISDYDLKYYLIALFAIADRTVTHIITANPSSLIRIMEVINRHSDRLIAAIHNGRCDYVDRTIERLPNTLQDRIKKHLNLKIKPNPKNAHFLSQIANRNPKNEMQCTDLWPNLTLLTTWTSGSVSIPLNNFLKQIPNKVEVYDPGYLASECRFTVTIDKNSQSGLPLINDHYYEFIETDIVDDINGDGNWLIQNNDNPPNNLNVGVKTQGLHELEVGKKYYIIVTTNTGLYRYFINDIIIVTSFYKNTPLIKFLQKGKGVTSLTGEKLHESQLLQSVTDACHDHNLDPVYIHALANEEALNYDVYVESSDALQKDRKLLKSMEVKIDEAISEHNCEYREKRAGNRLKKPCLYFLRPGCYEYYKKHLMKKGHRETQFKTVSIGYKRCNDFEFEKFVISL